MIKDCIFCGEKLVFTGSTQDYKRKFCDMVCTAKWHNRRRKELFLATRETINCRNCKIPFVARGDQFYCSKACRIKFWNDLQNAKRTELAEKRKTRKTHDAL